MNKKTIVVVGTSRGIGHAIVHQLAQQSDFTILALSRDVEKMKQSFDGISNVLCQHFDLSADVANQAKQLFEGISSIDVIINNAGLLVNKPFTELSHNDIASCYQVNVIGVMETVQAAVSKMNPVGSHIVNISSMGGFQGAMKFAGLSAYSTSKAALCSFTELFAEEYKDSTIKMNCLCLGAAQTEMLEEAFPGYIAPVSAEKMAEFIVDFALKGNQWMNGKILPVSLTTP
ncbi:MAG: SDR family oxidoreductase [Crocinitomicaceae bacterium]|nr:SDR family oxidoreductase [Crocinitomicaceae bacterium]MCF8433023.1 SDR family oxidoreductase [Crocinitomicaceae bacterium]